MYIDVLMNHLHVKYVACGGGFSFFFFLCPFRNWKSMSLGENAPSVAESTLSHLALASLPRSDFPSLGACLASCVCPRTATQACLSTSAGRAGVFSHVAEALLAPLPC